MSVERYIAQRYLRARSEWGTTHVITAISAAAVGVVTAAMLCVMSVMNGFGVVVEELFSRFDPDLKIVAAAGKTFHTAAIHADEIAALPYVACMSSIVTETALARFEDRQMPVTVMGVDTTFGALTGIEDIITDGHYEVYDGAFDRAVPGEGLAWKLGVGAHFVDAIHLYAPKRCGRVNMLRPDDSFNEEYCFIAGTFAVRQMAYDDQVMLVSIDLSRRLLDFDADEVSAIAIQLKDGCSMKKARRAISRIVGEGYDVQDRYRQQEDFFRILTIEKWLTTLLMAFIMLIACCNIISSLSMLIMDKQRDIRILSNLGATEPMIRRIFFYEGWLTSAIGAIGGLIGGLVLCLVQQQFGLLKLGTGEEYILSAYPVRVEILDIVAVGLCVVALGALAAWIPAKRIRLER